MSAMAKPVSNKDVDKLLQESEQIKAETAALRPKANWVHRRLEQIIAENHLSERIRLALGE